MILVGHLGSTSVEAYNTIADKTTLVLQRLAIAVKSRNFIFCVVAVDAFLGLFALRIEGRPARRRLFTLTFLDGPGSPVFDPGRQVVDPLGHLLNFYSALYVGE